ncbi:MAG: ABC transporter ATP-binding protein [Caldilinea sp.]|nr:ABC transporter ATP-binding protein [Caldilineaceae bacterium]MCB9122476.1 ABC transporter ATP-binding protein [Caldilineaceae bacterium]MCO5213301.1 ABC transporter ATP-binding protein [Caldilinea sp.]MCW5840785.1 ABC transporter ATP-binding protein [Caldilinea sp.]
MAELRLEHIYKTYKGGVEAVKDLNLTVRDGEFLALLGPSGCGKTSTLRMIVGLEEITRGEMYIGNRLVNKLEPNQRNVALAFETYALYPPLSVFDNIAFCLRARSVPKPEISQRVKQVADMLDITDILDRKPAELGGGQKQRISLARALVRDPDVFLMDEPLSHLDAAQRSHMRVELKRLHAQTGRTTILVTHDQLEAVAMAQRIAVMNFGVLQQVGTFDEIYNRPVNEFVAGFIGEPPMNFLPATPVREDGTFLLVAADNSFRIRVPESLHERLERSGAKKVDVGIRPIHLEVVDQPADALEEIDATVATFESLGEEGQLAAVVGTQTVLAVTSPLLRLDRSDAVKLRLRPDRIHLFDAATQAAI